MSYNRLSLGSFLETVFLAENGLMARTWGAWFSTGLIPAVNNTTPLTIPGPYANDAAAKTAGVPLQGLYYDASGVPHVRIV